MLTSNLGTPDSSIIIFFGALYNPPNIWISTGVNDIRYLQRTDKVFNTDNINVRASESVNTYDSYGNIISNIKIIKILSFFLNYFTIKTFIRIIIINVLNNQIKKKTYHQNIYCS